MWENSHPEIFRAQAATDAPLSEPPFTHPGGREVGEAGLVGVVEGQLWLSLAGTRALPSHGVLRALGLLVGTSPLCHLALLAFLCHSAGAAALLAPQG